MKIRYSQVFCIKYQSSIQPLLNEAEQDMKNSTDQGKCYPPRPITPSFIQNNSKFKNQLKRALIPLSMLSSCISILHLYREGQDIKVCSSLLIYFKQQLPSRELSSSCCSWHVFRQYFAAKRVKCSSDCSAIFF